MYLSRIFLDPTSRQVQSEMANRYELHRTLTAQFPQAQRDEIGLLYRLEIHQDQPDRPLVLLAQSQTHPSWETLYQKGYLLDYPDVKTFELAFPVGCLYHFRLLANPSKRLKQPDGKSKRVGIYQLTEQEQWLKRKSGQSGFEVLDLRVLVQGLVRGSKHEKDEQHSIKHLGVQFEGVLRVEDSDLLKKSVADGIGSAKAFGFGMLSLARSS